MPYLTNPLSSESISHIHSVCGYSIFDKALNDVIFITNPNVPSHPRGEAMVNPKLRHYYVPRIRMQGISAATSWIAINGTPEISIMRIVSASALLHELTYSAPDVPYVIFIYDNSALTDQEYEAGIRALNAVGRELGFRIVVEFNKSSGWMPLPSVATKPKDAPLVYSQKVGLSECFKEVNSLAGSTGSNPTLNAIAAIFWSAIALVRCANLLPFEVSIALLDHDVDNPHLEQYIDLKVDTLAAHILGEISQTCLKRFMFIRTQ